jgi:hypothetical protein
MMTQIKMRVDTLQSGVEALKRLQADTAAELDAMFRPSLTKLSGEL